MGIIFNGLLYNKSLKNIDISRSSNLFCEYSGQFGRKGRISSHQEMPKNKYIPRSDPF